MRNIVIIGGGAAGVMAAGSAAEHGASVFLVEKNDGLGKKLLITGGGRCNVTNTADVGDFVRSVPRNPKFLYCSLHNFGSQALRDFLHEHGLATKVEEDGRVFPVSDVAADVLCTFENYLKRRGVNVMLNVSVTQILPRGANDFLVLLTDGRKIDANSIIIATGGLSYPNTGSTGDGHRLAQGLGHNVTKLYPSIVPLVVETPSVTGLMGLALPEVGLIVKCDGKTIYKDYGDIIFTHFGLSGPMMLRASAHLAKKLHLGCEFYLDFARRLSEKSLEDSILETFVQNPNKDVKNALDRLFAGRLVSELLAISNIECSEKSGRITKERRKTLCRRIKHFKLTVTGSVGFGAAVVTCGGVDCSEIDPSTMESKLIKSLYFAGEVMDVDALCGGYNLTIAFSTGWLAGRSAAL